MYLKKAFPSIANRRTVHNHCPNTPKTIISIGRGLFCSEISFPKFDYYLLWNSNTYLKRDKFPGCFAEIQNWRKFIFNFIEQALHRNKLSRQGADKLSTLFSLMLSRLRFGKWMVLIFFRIWLFHLVSKLAKRNLPKGA